MHVVRNTHHTYDTLHSLESESNGGKRVLFTLPKNIGNRDPFFSLAFVIIIVMIAYNKAHTHECVLYEWIQEKKRSRRFYFIMIRI